MTLVPPALRTFHHLFFTAPSGCQIKTWLTWTPYVNKNHEVCQKLNISFQNFIESYKKCSNGKNISFFLILFEFPFRYFMFLHFSIFVAFHYFMYFKELLKVFAYLKTFESRFFVTGTFPFFSWTFSSRFLVKMILSLPPSLCTSLFLRRVLAICNLFLLVKMRCKVSSQIQLTIATVILLYIFLSIEWRTLDRLYDVVYVPPSLFRPSDPIRTEVDGEELIRFRMKQERNKRLARRNLNDIDLIRQQNHEVCAIISISHNFRIFFCTQRPNLQSSNIFPA